MRNLELPPSEQEPIEQEQEIAPVDSNFEKLPFPNFESISSVNKFEILLDDNRFSELTSFLQNAEKKELKTIQKALREEPELEANFQEKMAEILTETGLSGLDQVETLVNQLLTNKKQLNDFFKTEPLQKIAIAFASDALGKEIDADINMGPSQFERVNNLFAIPPVLAQELIVNTYKVLIQNNEIQKATALLERLNFDRDTEQYRILNSQQKKRFLQQL